MNWEKEYLVFFSIFQTKFIKANGINGKKRKIHNSDGNFDVSSNWIDYEFKMISLKCQFTNSMNVYTVICRKKKKFLQNGDEMEYNMWIYVYSCAGVPHSFEWGI